MKMSSLAQELHQEFMHDSTEYCCYCGDQRSRMSCCGENHFERYRDMDERTQQEILSNEIEIYEKATQ